MNISRIKEINKVCKQIPAGAANESTSHLVLPLISRIKRLLWLFTMPMAIFLLSGSVANAAPRYSVATGNWASTGTWSATSGGGAGASVPTSGDDVFIERGNTVTINASGATCASLTVGTSTAGTLSISYATTTGTFTVLGNVSIASIGSFLVTNTTNANTHTVYISGNLTINGAFNMCSASDDYATVVFNGNAQQTISGSGSTCTFYSLTASNTGASGLVLGRNITVAPTSVTSTIVTVTAGDIFDLGTYTCNRMTTGAGSFIVNGILKIGGTNTFPANYSTNTIGSASTVEYEGANQSAGAYAYNNLILSGGGDKSIVAGTSVMGNLSIAHTGTAKASIGTGLNISVGKLMLGGNGTAGGTWGSSSSTALHQNNAYFSSTSGIVDVGSSSCVVPNATVVKTDISCFNASNGQIVVTGANGSGTYEYSIYNGIPVSTYQSSNTFNALAPGQYKIRVRDTNTQCESIQMP